MARFAEGTSVPVGQSKAELEQLLAAHGADDVVTGQSQAERKILLQFRYAGIPCRLTVALPDPKEEQFWRTPTGLRRPPAQAAAQYEAELRRVWRVLILSVKARFEEIDNLLFTPEQAFVSWMLLPDGSTLNDRATAGVKTYLAGGEAPRGLMMITGPQATEPKKDKL